MIGMKGFVDWPAALNAQASGDNSQYFSLSI